MQTDYEIVIADTTCFILLDKIGEMELLRSLFGQVNTTTIIAEEFGSALPQWIKINPVENIQLPIVLDIDLGEASAIALALEFDRCLLILDDGKGRKAARKLNLNITGTLGIFLRAKREGLISAIWPIIEKVQSTNFRYSQAILDEILSIAGE